MTTDRGCFGLAIALALAACLLSANDASAQKERKPFPFLYVSLDDDPDYAESRAYTGLVLKDRKPLIDGAATAVRESRIIGRSQGLAFTLEELTLEEGGGAGAAVAGAMGESAAAVALLDLPMSVFRNVTGQFEGRDDVILFNIRHATDALRQAECAAAVFHTLPSQRMLNDALAQYLKSRGWTRVLVLAGEGEADADTAESFAGSATKFGLTIVDSRPFVLSNDPREREKNNVALLTGGARYDVVFLADEQGEFGRYVPFATFHPRPIVGSEGLTPAAWHWTWERHGAPQLNQRFDRTAERRMLPEDFAAWAAVRAVVEAIVRSGSTDIAAIRDTLTSDDFTFDTYLGTPGNFRPWNHQLRLPVLLHTHNAVIARAPIEGFLHKDNLLDTLGVDRAESECRLDTGEQ